MNLNGLRHLNYLTSLLKRKIDIYQYFQTKLYFASEKLQEKPEETPKTRKRLSHKTEIDDFFNSNEELKFIKKHVPTQILRYNLSTPENLYLIDKEVAKTIVFKIKDRLKVGNGLIIEVNPGLGFLTRELIQAGFKKIEVFESKTQFLEQLLNSQLPHVNLRSTDFLNIWKYAYQDRFDNGTRVADILKNVKIKPWNSGPSMKIIGAVSNLNFIKHLIYSITFQFGIATYGRPELFFVMPPSDYNVNKYYDLAIRYLKIEGPLLAQPETGYLSYRATSVLFQLFFDIEFLQKLPRKAFLPWQSSQKKNSRKSSNDSDHLYLVHIIGKKNLPVPNDQLQALWYFVRHHMCSRKNRVIPQMERWIPGCGARLISASNRSKKRDHFKDIGIFTQFGELLPDQILDLFKYEIIPAIGDAKILARASGGEIGSCVKQFVSMPEFSESPFIASMESSLLKLEATEESASGIEPEQDITPPGTELEQDVTQTNLNTNENLNEPVNNIENKQIS